MSVLDFLYIIKRYRWLVLTIPIALAALAGVYASLKPPLYGATVIMSPAGTSEDLGSAARIGGPLGSLIGISGLAGGVGTGKDEALAVLRSRHFTDEFIADHGLMQILYASSWDEQNEVWTVESVGQVPTLGGAYRRFNESIRFISEDPKTGLISLEIRWFDRAQAAEWANALVERLNERLRQQSIDEAERSLQYLNQQLDNTSLVELRQSIFGLIERNIRQVMLANGRKEFAFRVIDPAVPPEEGNYLNTTPVLFVIVGLVAGGLLAIMLALAHFFFLGEGRAPANRASRFHGNHRDG